MLLPRFRIRTLIVAVAAAALVPYVGVLSSRRSASQKHAEYHALQRYFALSDLLRLSSLWRVPPPGYREKLSKAEAEYRRQDKLVGYYTYAAEHPWRSLSPVTPPDF